MQFDSHPAAAAVLEALNTRHWLEFTCGGERYRIQTDNNKGCDYLSLWRLGENPTRLGQELYDILYDLDEADVSGLLCQPLLHGESFFALWEQGRICSVPETG